MKEEARCHLSPHHYPPSITQSRKRFLCSFFRPPTRPVFCCASVAPPARVTSTEVENLCVFHPACPSLNERCHRSLTSSFAALQKWWLCDAPLSLILEVLRSDFSSTPPAYRISSGWRLLFSDEINQIFPSPIKFFMTSYFFHCTGEMLVLVAGEIYWVG